MDTKHGQERLASLKLDESTNTSQSIDWYAEGQSRVVEADGVTVTVRYVGRKGRRGRIVITAPLGATFRS